MSETTAQNIRICQWGESEFLNAAADWQELQSDSNADPLFSGWLWQSSWWTHFAERNQLRLFIVVAEDQDGRLLGIAPLFKRVTVIRKIVRIRRIELIGNIFRGAETMHSEYLGFIVRRRYERDVATALYNYALNSKHCDELILSDMRTDSVTFTVAQDTAKRDSLFLRSPGHDEGFAILLQDGFSSYLRQLSGNARRKMFNQRARLENSGNVSFETVGQGELEAFFSILNDLHQRRWGKKAFEGESLDFVHDMAQKLQFEGQFASTILYQNGKPISALFDLVCGGRRYNIQMGFDPMVQPNLSLGLLHLGYAIEDSYRLGYESYQLLVGSGKTTEYKARLCQERIGVGTMRIILPRWLQSAHRIFSIFTH